MADITPGMIFTDTLRNKRPKAMAWIQGNAQNPQLSGIVKFYETPYAGVLVEAEIFGLPNIDTQFSSDFYAMHIHEKGDCPLTRLENIIILQEKRTQITPEIWFHLWGIRDMHGSHFMISVSQYQR